MTESQGCRREELGAMSSSFLMCLVWIPNKAEVAACRPDATSSENAGLLLLQMCWGLGKSRLQLLAWDISTGATRCSICWLQLQLRALALTCKTWNVLELLVWDVISFLCPLAIHEITSSALGWQALNVNQMSAEKLSLRGLQPLISSPLPNFHPIYKEVVSRDGHSGGLLYVLCDFFHHYF